ncbi:hypothetical protein [Synechococcus sp. UW140]|uniref:hypothetical protein n=1 Tax=Synechococcus sp. UW140 TaxID=368503 RepID=UPI0025D80DB3|nr:hypothetical protein [Synechococcus sp. UW140]
MLGASWVDGHSIAALAAQHNQLLNALLLAAERNKVGLLCGKQQLRPYAGVAPRRAFPLQKPPPAPGPCGRSVACQLRSRVAQAEEGRRRFDAVSERPSPRGSNQVSYEKGARRPHWGG